ncbi:MAG: S8/S53 family peptidase [Ignavibacteriaceae bacterium]|jgi:thermitase
MKTISIMIKIISFFTILNLIFCINIFPQEKVAGRIVKSASLNGKTVKFISGEVAVKFGSSVSRSIVQTYLAKFNLSIKGKSIKPGWSLIDVPQGSDELSTIAMLKKMSFVKNAEPNYLTNAFSEPNDTYFKTNQWALRNARQSGVPGTWDADIDATDAWDITTGSSNVVLAILDTGIPMLNGSLSHPDLNDPNRIIIGSDYIGDGESVRDLFGHGTNVAGIAGAETNNSTGISGIAQNCKLLIIQVFDANGHGSSTSFYNGVIEAVNYQRNHLGTRIVINYSGGSSVSSQQMEDAIDSANVNGIPIVAAAGNDDGGAVEYPAAYSTSYSNVIAVSATDQNDVIASYSSVGPQIDVSAPGGVGPYNDNGTTAYNGSDNEGDNIYSTEPNYSFNLQNGTDVSENYGYLAGTSQAAPQVTGTIGLMLSINSSLSASQIRNLMEQYADDKGPTGFDDQYGYGRLNALKSVANAFVLANPQYQYTVGTASLSLYSTDFQMDFLNSPAPGVPVGRYNCDRYVVEVTKNGFSQTPNGWITDSPGFSWANPNDASPYVIKSTTSNSITLQTVFYYIKSDLATGQTVNKWAPFDPNNAAVRKYATLGIPVPPLSVYITGPSTAQCQTSTWTANTSGGSTPYSYQWYQKWDCGGGAGPGPLRPCGTWNAVGTNSSTLQFYWCGGNGYLRVDVTDAQNGIASAQYYVTGSGGIGPKAVDNSLETLKKVVPELYDLGQNYPNPFNPTTQIKYALKEDGFVEIKVYDLLGKEVATLVNENKSAGFYTVNFDASRLSSGIYFYTIKTKDFFDRKKMVVLK